MRSETCLITCNRHRITQSAAVTQSRRVANASPNGGSSTRLRCRGHCCTSTCPVRISGDT